MKTAGPEHPIVIAPEPRRLVVRAGGRIVADSMAALTLREASYPPVHYIPRADIAMDLLERTATASHCPYKGDAAYYSAPGERGRDAAWTYETPYPAVAAIRDHLAFYPDRVDAIEVGVEG